MSIETVKKALNALKNGKWVLLLDDANRENECDLVFAAESMTQEQMALMIRECSGIVCLVITEETAKKLELPMMVQHNESRYGTGFTVSIEAKEWITTGVSAHDRIKTIQTAISDDTTPQDLARPGHVFPLVAKKGWLTERRWHTEGSMELVQLAGLKPFAVLCELMTPDGTMATLSYSQEFAKKYWFEIISIQDIIDYKSSL